MKYGLVNDSAYTLLMLPLLTCRDTALPVPNKLVCDTEPDKITFSAVE